MVSIRAYTNIYMLLVLKDTMTVTLFKLQLSDITIYIIKQG